MSNHVVPANTSIKSFLPHLTIALIHHLKAGAIKIAQLAQTETQRERERERERKNQRWAWQKEPRKTEPRHYGHRLGIKTESSSIELASISLVASK